MEKALAINYLYPDLEFGKDFEVLDDSDKKGPYILWYNTDVTEPSQEELQTAWVEVEKQLEINKVNNEFEAEIKAYKENLKKEKHLTLEEMRELYISAFSKEENKQDDESKNFKKFFKDKQKVKENKIKDLLK